MTAPKTTLRLSVPAQQLERLSFCNATPEAFDQWLSELPMAAVDEVAKHLYRAVVEIPQLKCGLEDRFAMIEALRAHVHFTCVGLARRFLNQPVLVNETMRRYANQCQVLQNQLAVGYKVVVVQAIQSKVAFGPGTKPNEVGSLVPIAIFRTLSELTMTILRACQLYTDALPKAWLELNQLLMVSERTGVSSIRLDEHADDEQKGPFTIRQAYLRAALLATASPNKLRQRQLSGLFDQLADWSKYVEVSTGVVDGSFVVDLTKDDPPVYGPAYEGESHDLCRTLNTDPLVNLLDAAVEQHAIGDVQNAHRLQIGGGLSQDLLAHAANAWGRRSKRAFSRLPSTGKLYVCIGFSAAHYHLADGHDFESLLRKGHIYQPLIKNRFSDRNDIFQPSANGFGSPQGVGDVWSNAFDSGSGARIPENPDIEDLQLISEPVDEEPARELDLATYPIHETNMVDTSPGGYCIRWKDAAPPNLQTGELLAIRENAGQRWALGVVRWIRHAPDSGTLVGLELLSPAAVPVGARVLSRKNEEPQFMRGLLMPSIPVLRQIAMLVLPRISFSEGQRVLINQSGNDAKAVLSKLVASTDAFAQFEFRYIEAGQSDPSTARTRVSSGFDQLFSEPES